MYEQEKWELRDETARRLGLPSADDVALAMIEPFTGRTAPVSARRRERLRGHLVELAQQPPGEAASRAPEPATGLEPPRLDEVCRACRGFCCRKGANHAYLTAADLRRGEAAPAGADAEALAQAYLSHVPARAYRGSCIFHAATGCALPRSLRSEICRRYFCKPMTALRTRVSAPAATVVVFSPAQGRRRVTIRRAAQPE